MTPEGYKKHKKLIEAWANGSRIQYRLSGGEWENYPERVMPAWLENTSYRIKPATPDYINWDHVHPKYKYLARSPLGTPFLYTKLPRKAHNNWYCVAGWVVDAELFSSYKQGTVDWKDSLVCRHDNQS